MRNPSLAQQAELAQCGQGGKVPRMQRITLRAVEAVRNS